MATKRVKVSSPPSDTPAERARLALKEPLQGHKETDEQFYVRLAKKYSSLTDDQWNKLPDYVIGWLNAQVEIIATEKHKRENPVVITYKEFHDEKFGEYLEKVAPDHMAWWREGDAKQSAWNFWFSGNLSFDDPPAITIVLERNAGTVDKPSIERRSLLLYIDGRKPAIVWDGVTEPCVPPVVTQLPEAGSD